MNKINIAVFVFSLFGNPYGSLHADDSSASTVTAKPKTRVFRFDYGATLSELPKDAEVRIWLPVPQTNAEQRVQPLEHSLPSKHSTATEAKFGNRILYLETIAPANGKLALRTSYLIRRSEVLRKARCGSNQIVLSDAQREKYLSANNKVPITGKPLDLLTSVLLPEDTLELAKVLYDRVDAHVKYDKSKPGYGNGDVLWVCDSRFGNCTDFHSLFISLARAQGIPARFEIGFPIPTERGTGKIGGYHCWAFFYSPDCGWLPVDISEADKNPRMSEYYFGNLTEDRVAFSTGRDLELVPKQSGPPLNFFVYPHVEVNGEALSKENIALEFRYEDRVAKKP